MSKFSRTPPAPSTPDEFIKGADPIDESPPPSATKKKPKQVTNADDVEPAAVSSRSERPAGAQGLFPPVASERTKKPDDSTPWKHLDPKATARRSFILRLNEYEYALLKYLGSQNPDLSMHKVAKRLLVPELEKHAGVGD